MTHTVPVHLVSGCHGDGQWVVTLVVVYNVHVQVVWVGSSLMVSSDPPGDTRWCGVMGTGITGKHWLVTMVTGPGHVRHMQVCDIGRGWRYYGYWCYYGNKVCSDDHISRVPVSTRYLCPHVTMVTLINLPVPPLTITKTGNLTCNLITEWRHLNCTRYTCD